MISRIKNIVEQKINPYLELHQGSCEVISFEDGVLTIRLHGGCVGCPSSKITLYQGIEPILKEEIPEIESVVLG